MSEVKYEYWMNMVKELNAEKPSLLDLVNRQIQQYEQEKKEESN